MNCLRKPLPYACCVLLALLLAACGGPTRPVASVERAAAFAARGDHAAAAREYEAVAAATAESVVANAALLPAAGEWLRAGDAAAAEQTLGRLLPPLDAEQTDARGLLLAEAALLRGDAARGWEILAAVRAPLGAARIEAYHALRQRLALASNRPLQAIRSHAEREAIAGDAAAVAQLRREFLAALSAAVDRGNVLDPRVAGRDTSARGWLEAAPLAARAARAPIAANPGITAAWRKRYPTHPAAAALGSLGQVPPPPRLETAAATPTANTARSGPATPGSSVRPIGTVAGGAATIPSGVPLPAAAHVAVLLPLSGRNAAAGAQLRDGLLAAHYAEPESTRTPLRFYDTARQTIAEAFAAARRGGAVYVIGPLVREEVAAAVASAGEPGAPPVLALNFLPAEQAAPTANFRQFALSPEDEARAVARRALAEGRRRAVALVPAGEWGTRVLGAFRAELEQGGGTLLAVEALAGREIGPTIQGALRIDDSIARHRRVQAALDTPLAFQPRRRADIDFVFMPGPAASIRQWRPQLRFQGGGDLPAYATADVWDGRSGAELAGIVFPDMDWMIAPESPVAAALRGTTTDAFGDTRGRGRLFAFGHDAWLLQAALRAGRPPTVEAPINGASGALFIDADGRVERSLRWAQIDDTGFKLLPAPGGG
ncbi:MAG: penicillin-binding protein activator [Gammaproteobacteria bacterium]|nr:penicillin-binding protein activator [Gammaproteobacteria bacterium]